MRYLILLNRKYPYASGEAFLENEIDEISKYFDKVVILPNNMTSDDKITRKINSQNVDVVAFEKSSVKLRNMLYATRGVFCKKDTMAKGFKQKMYSGYFESAVKSQVRKILKVLEQYHFDENDEVILYSYWLFITAKVAVLLKEELNKYTNVVCVSRAHNFDIYEEKRYLPQRKFLLKNLDAVYPCSNNGTQYLQAKYNDYAKKIETAYLGTYDHGISRKVGSDTLKIISCSRIVPVKRLDLMIESFKMLKDSGLKLSWTHLGGGELYEHIKQRANTELDFMEVNFPGMISNTEVYDYYQNEYFDVFLNVSSAEGLPVSIMEAASFGIPTIVTDVGGSAEIIEPGKTGIVLAPDFKPSELAEVIIGFAKMTRQEKEQWHRETRELWLTNFQAPVNYAKFADQLTKCLRASLQIERK